MRQRIRPFCVGQSYIVSKRDQRRVSMTADAAKLYPRHRDRISGSEAYMVRHFARQNGITPAQVHQLIKRYGSNRARLVAAAKELRASLRPDVPKAMLASGRRAGRLSASVDAGNGLGTQ
ncbi:MAG: DUF3606 domain-containing protein [Mesorhizobium sp.]|nr:MAG: DUF3606 domain-containing protein [Mesorhizobium sp.]RWN62974.1 MAG: DUF3606 domain-containing protein [Mesorhizobium sp.]RWN72849.1 MAG: DUF3606 domain-containing protein [Mesorhizobium sp.]RWN72960.1 MAG: DUF3606 domain-containing protein [Mesorhizobium sp.]RWN84412.1 MAG: DUF3606 domain-containing protein [Mesorhizobium sp.]